jgi:hypothetical protein
MKQLFDSTSVASSKLVTRAYSTSFSLGIYCLNKRFHDAIYSIYGFVRFADEIVDTFHEFNKNEFEKKNVSDILASNTYVGNDNVPNFESNVADISKFYNMSFDNMNEDDLRNATPISSKKLPKKSLANTSKWFKQLEQAGHLFADSSTLE